MRAVLLRKPGPPEALTIETLPDPTPGPGEVLISVRAAGVNFADVLARQGLYPEAPKRPFVPGFESAGEVAALGSGVSNFRVGQHVLAYHLSGGYAEKVVAPAERVFALPDSLSFQTAVVLPLNYGTAYVALYRTGPVEPGMRVFVHAAAGGVGLAALDLGRRAGLEMTGAASTHFKRARLLHAGVLHVVSSKRLRVDRLSSRIYGGPAFDIVLDSVGGKTVRQGLRALRPGGRVVSLGVGSLSGGGLFGAIRFLLSVPRFTFLDLLQPSVGLHGVNLRRLMEHPALVRTVIEQLLAWTASGEIKPEPGRVMPIEEVAIAHRLLEKRTNVGKIVLRVGD
ncbi:MAG TPA: zinc-binding dehydrogenase [Candidatus Eisenbacteria bacterium]|nr:zinc-binding dehydrogenase [Candidatus Eisenbacteria bacterium]